MSKYQHKRGEIKDNAIEALLHDPLFRQRVEKNKKEKEKKNKKSVGRPAVIGLFTYYHWPLVNFCSFKRSRISDNRTSSLDGGAGSAGAASFSRRTLFMTLIAIKIANATITKSKNGLYKHTII